MANLAVTVAHAAMDQEAAEVAMIRHYQPPGHKPVSSTARQNRSKISYLMQTPCLPEPNGYFGSTAGSPAVFQYGFSIESKAFSNIDKILDVVDDHVMDMILSKTFPGICGGFRRKLLVNSLADSSSSSSSSVEASRITGFKFMERSIETALTCTPQQNPSNDCGYFKHTVKVFGHNLNWDIVGNTINSARDAIPESLALASKDGVVRLEVSDDLTRQISGPNFQGGVLGTSKGNGNSARVVGVKIGLAAAVFTLVVAIVVLTIYLHTDYNRKKKEKAKRKRAKRKKESFDVKSLYMDNSKQGQRKDRYASGETQSDGSETYWDSASESHCKLTTDGSGTPIVLEFGTNFDPVRDRFIIEQDEESSYAPPDYYDQLSHAHSNQQLGEYRDL